MEIEEQIKENNKVKVFFVEEFIIFFQEFRKDVLDKMALMWICAKMHPFSIVEDEELRDMFKYVNPMCRLVLLHRSRVREFGLKHL